SAGRIFVERARMPRVTWVAVRRAGELCSRELARRLIALGAEETEMRGLIVTVVGFVLALGSVGAPFAAATSPSITVGVAPSPDMALLIIAVRRDFLKNEGLDAKLQVFESSPSALQGVVAGRADITVNTEPPQLAARARGGKIVQVMTGYLSGRQNGLVVNGKAISKPADFVGKAIGVQRGSGGNYH